MKSNEEEIGVKDLIKQLVEYILAMRIELERRSLAGVAGQEVRALELSCYMTLCGIQPVHKYLSYKQAMTANYKAENFITAAHFCKLILNLESYGIFGSKPQELDKFKAYYQKFQKKGTNATKINFDTQASSDVLEANGYICAGSLQILTAAREFSQTVRCPLSGAVHGKEFAGQLCSVSQMTKLGEDALGLQIRMEDWEEEEEDDLALM